MGRKGSLSVLWPAKGKYRDIQPFLLRIVLTNIRKRYESYCHAILTIQCLLASSWREYFWHCVLVEMREVFSFVAFWKSGVFNGNSRHSRAYWCHYNKAKCCFVTGSSSPESSLLGKRKIKGANIFYESNKDCLFATSYYQKWPLAVFISAFSLKKGNIREMEKIILGKTTS